jgi:AAA+ superfamily predicted ATPase
MAGLGECEYILKLTPERRLGNIFMGGEYRQDLLDLIAEQHNSSVLHQHSVRARNKVLIFGGAGNGKTSLAEAMATEMMYDMGKVVTGLLLDGHGGDLFRRIEQVFFHVLRHRCVLLFENVETIIAEKMHFFLDHIESLPDYVVTVFTVEKHPEECLSERFNDIIQCRVFMDGPHKDDVIGFIDLMKKRLGSGLGMTTEEIASKARSLSFRGVEDLCFRLRRKELLATKDAPHGQG